MSSSSYKLPIVCVVPIPAYWEGTQAVKAAVEATVADGIFSRYVKGNTVEEFASLQKELSSLASSSTTSDKKDDEDVEIVLLVGGPGSHDVMKDIISWPTKAKNGTSSRVRWIHTMFTGVDALDLPGLRPLLDQHDIKVSNAHGAYNVMLAEHVLFSTLYFNRQLTRLLKNRKEGVYDRFSSVSNAGQTMVIIGYGSIGQAVARMAIAGFGMKVIGLRRSVTTSVTDDIGVLQLPLSSETQLNEALYKADFVLNALPLTPDTHHFCNSERIFSKMNPNKGVFINIGRGPTVKEVDVVKALQVAEGEVGGIKGAALDVFEVEPLPSDSPLWNTEGIPDSKLLLTPHNADVSDTTFGDSARHFTQVLAKEYVESGGQKLPDYLVALDRGY